MGTIICPNAACGRKVALPEGVASRRLRCPYCLTRINTADSGGDSARSIAGRPTGAPSPAAQPQRVGRFHLRQRLGAGAFAGVYRAYDPQLDREVALKLPHPGTLDSPARVERFLREAKAAANLRHPNIVPLYESGRDGERYFIASAFIEGTTLADVLEEHHNLVPEYAARLVRALAAALAYAHEQGVVHRDVKPANVMLDGKGQPMLLDFGLASRKEEASKLTNEGALLGTPAYMAPEQASGKSGAVGPAADQYSLGCLLYELLTGQPPFSGPAEAQVFHHLRTEPSSPRKVNAAVPEDLAAVCLRCLEKEPSRRYADCAALAEDLRRWLAGEPTTARPLDPAQRLSRWARRNPVVAGLALGLAAVLATGVLVSSLFAWRAVRGEEQARIQAELARSHAEEAKANAAHAQEQQQLAETNERKAEEQRQLAEANERKARQAAAAEREATKREAEQRTQAEEAREHADQLTREAQQARAEAVREAEATRRREYFTTMLFAQAAWEQHNAARVADLLERYKPQPGQTDLRGFEWYYWNNVTERGHVTLRGDTGYQVPSVCFSPDSRRLASAGSDGTVRIWDMAAAKETALLRGHKGRVFGICFSPDGRLLASAGSDGTVRIWDMAAAKETAAFRAKCLFTAVCFSPDGQRLASVGNVMLRIWAVRTAKEVLTLKGYYTAISYSPDGHTLAFLGSDGVHIWDVALAKEMLILKGLYRLDFASQAISFSPDGHRLAAVRQDGKMCVWDVVTFTEILAVKGQYTRGVCFSPDGTRLACAGLDGTVRILDAATGNTAGVLSGHAGVVWSVCFSPDGRRLASGGEKATILVWDLTAVHDSVAFKSHESRVSSVVFNPDAGLLASAGHDGTIRVWDAATCKEVQTFRGGKGMVNAICYSHNGKHLAAAGQEGKDGTVRIWDAVTGRSTLTLKGHEYGVSGVCFSPDGQQLASSGQDDTIRIWDAATGREIRRLGREYVMVGCVCYSPDGKRLASGGIVRKRGPLGTNVAGVVKIWDAASGQEIAVMNGDERGVNAVCYRPDGKRLASAGGDGTVRIWDAETFQEAAVLKGHGGGVNSVCYSPDGKRLVSAGADSTVRVWAADAATEVLTLTGHDAGEAACACFSSDGRRLASAWENGTVRIWDAAEAVKTSP
jgi:WD40 repeat protein/tRNA A-37 threonylcarbamoyl transferase component Bud32